MRVSEQRYLKIALEEQDEKWELHCGRLRCKPPMTYHHNRLGYELSFQLRLQLSPGEFEVRADAGRARRTARNYFIPDVMVIPKAYTLPLRDRQDVLEAYSDPLPLVVEVWSPSTGDYDVASKLPEYQRRGDREIWLVHPFERTVTAWRQQPDGSYSETIYRGGAIEPIALPGVSVNLDTLFNV